MLPHPFFRQIFLTRTRPRVSWSPAPRAPLTNIQPLAEDDADDASASEGENVQPLAEDDSAEDDASDSRSASEDPQPLAKEEKESEEKGSEEEGEEASRSRSRQVTLRLRPRSQARPASGGQSGRFISSRSRAARSRSRSNSHTEHLVSDRTGDEILRHWDQSGEAVIRFGYHNLIPHPVLNYVWIGAKKKLRNLPNWIPYRLCSLKGETGVAQLLAGGVQNVCAKSWVCFPNIGVSGGELLQPMSFGRIKTASTCMRSCFMRAFVQKTTPTTFSISLTCPETLQVSLWRLRTVLPHRR